MARQVTPRNYTATMLTGVLTAQQTLQAYDGPVNSYPHCSNLHRSQLSAGKKRHGLDCGTPRETQHKTMEPQKKKGDH